MFKKNISIAIVLTLVMAAFAIMPFSNVSATTEEEIEDSIELGLSRLALQQNPDGSWGTGSLVSTTGLAVLKFIDRVKEIPEIDSWTDPDYIYHDVVVNGLDYLFINGYYVDITVQTYGDPDTLDNDKGIRFIGFDDYETSIALMALGATMTPSRVVTAVGPLNGLTYADVVQDVVDYLSYTQRESANARGGWGYEGQLDWADNSVSGYVSLGLGYAQAFGATIPQFVKDELVIWINQIQAPDGHSYYRPPVVWQTPYGDLLLRTGNLLYEMALVGWPVDHPQVQLALSFIENNWALGGNSYQRSFCLMKGLEVYGIDDEISVGVSGDWFEELSTYIVTTQNLDGSWPNDPHDGSNPFSMTASWALLTLEKVVAMPKMKIVDLIAGGGNPNSAIDVGEVTVTQDDEYLYVTYETTDDWFITETHLHIAWDEDGNVIHDFPTTKKGNPIIGHFDYSMVHDPPVQEYTYEIPWDEDWPVKATFYIATHSVVHKIIDYDEEQNPIYQTETAWGDGLDGIPFPGNNWAKYFEYIDP